MPELPDIQVFANNLKLLLAGSKLLSINIVNGKKLKDSKADLKTLEGKTLKDVFRSGKELRFLFSDKNILGIHLMLTGDLKEGPIQNERITIAELRFSKMTITLTDRMKNAYVRLNPENKNGIDALDKSLNFKYLKTALNRKTNIKNVLLDQDVIRGIGNSYSDEILWETRISPFSVAKAIPDEKIKELASTIKKVLKKATATIEKTHPGLINGEVKEFLKIHTKKKPESPTGYPIKMADRGMLKTYYTDEQVEYK
jgi:formamidopyrimidine-DNA glycosylase